MASQTAPAAQASAPHPKHATAATEVIHYLTEQLMEKDVLLETLQRALKDNTTKAEEIVAGVRATAQRREQGLRTQLAERDKQIATMQDMLGTSKESKLFNGGDRAFMDDLLLTVLEQKDALADKLDALSNEYLKLKAKLGMSEFEKEKLEAESRAQQRRSAGSIGSAGSVGSLRQRSEDFTGAAPAAASAGRLFGSAPSVSSFRQTSDPGPRLSADSSRPRRESSDVVFDVANSRSMSLASVGEVDATMTEEVASHLADLEERGATANELAEADRTIQELRAQLEQSKASSRQDSRQRRKQSFKEENKSGKIIKDKAKFDDLQRDIERLKDLLQQQFEISKYQSEELAALRQSRSRPGAASSSTMVLTPGPF